MTTSPKMCDDVGMTTTPTPAVDPTTRITVSMTIADAQLVAEHLTRDIDTLSNHLASAVLNGDGERAIRLAEEREHLITAVRSKFNRALMEAGAQ